MPHAMTPEQGLALLTFLLDYEVGDGWSNSHHGRLLNAMTIAWPILNNALPPHYCKPTDHRSYCEHDDVAEARDKVGQFLEAWGRAVRRSVHAVDDTNELDKLRNEYDQANTDLAAREHAEDKILEAIPRQWRRSAGDGMSPVEASVRAMVARIQQADATDRNVERDAPHRAALRNALLALPFVGRVDHAGFTSLRGNIYNVAAEAITRLWTENKELDQNTTAAREAIPAGFRISNALDTCVRNVFKALDDAKELEVWFQKNAPWLRVPGDRMPVDGQRVLVLVKTEDALHAQAATFREASTSFLGEGINHDEWLGFTWPNVVAWRPLPKLDKAILTEQIGELPK